MNKIIYSTHEAGEAGEYLKNRYNERLTTYPMKSTLHLTRIQGPNMPQ